MLARNQPATLGHESSPGVLPPVLPSVRDTPYGWKNRAIFAVGKTGRRGPGLQTPCRQSAAYRGMQVSRGGQGRAWALSRGRRCLGPERVPGKARCLAPEAPVASAGWYHGAWSCSPGLRFTTGECLLQTPRAAACPFLHREVFIDLLGGPLSKQLHSLLWCFSTDFREFRMVGERLHPQSRLGEFQPKPDS